jgi:hypothetical protein
MSSRLLKIVGMVNSANFLKSSSLGWGLKSDYYYEIPCHCSGYGFDFGYDFCTNIHAKIICA